jgi:hypothetical protein
MTLALLGATACGGIGPGDYRVYRVAFEQWTEAPNCSETGVIPVDQQDDSSSEFVSGTFVFYVGADENFYLDSNGVALRGTETGEEDYSFSGSTTVVDIEGDPMDPGSVETTVTDLKVQFNIEGEVVEGNVERTDSYTCEGPNCMPDPTNQECTRTAPFIGGEVADVTLEHEV